MSKTYTLATDAYNQIKTIIFNGLIKPGEKLKGEYLKNKLGMGLSPIREALSKLSLTGFVGFSDKIGFSVATISKYKIYDVFETFARIEELLLSESIQKGNDEWEAHVLSNLYRLSKVENHEHKTTYLEWFNRNEAFHNALISGSTSESLISFRNQCLDLKNWYLNLAYGNDTELLIITNHNEHKRIADLAIARDKSVLTKLHYHNVNNIEACILKLCSKNYISQ